MKNYIKCPHCDLNYILEHEKYCKACDPKMRGNLISDLHQEYEEIRNTKWEEYTARNESLNDFYAIRYNRQPKR